MRKLFRLLSKDENKHDSKLNSDRLKFVSGAGQDTNIACSPYRVASCQSTGKERAHNEDTLFTLHTFLGGLEAPVAFGIFLVADGMGGHQSGELASNLAAQGISQYLMRHVYQAGLFERKSFSPADLERHLRNAVEEAQALVLRRVPGGGTTLTLALVMGDDVYSAHVGDSRLYLVGADDTLNLKTRDHSLVKRLVDLGEISESEAGHHPHRNVLYRALGQSDPFEPDIDAFTMGTGERLLICSDGLWGAVDQHAILNILNDGREDLDAKAMALVQAANEAGGPDNISVILVERLAY